MSTDEVQIKRSWVEHVTTKSGEEKLNFRIYYFDELSHKWRKKGKRILKDTPQARRKALNELERDIKRNYDRFSTQSYTLGKLRDAYIEHVASGESSLRYQTAYQYEANLNQFFKTIDPKMMADEVTTAFLYKYFNKEFAKGLSYSTVNNRRNAISSLYQFGIEYGYCHTNPTLPVKLKRRINDMSLVKTEDRYFTADELRKVLLYYKHFHRQDVMDLIEFIYFTGLRIGEAVSLYVTDVFKSGGKYFCRVDGTQVMIYNKGKAPKSNRTRKEISSFRGKGVSRIIKQRATKTNSGMRFVELDEPAVAIWKRCKKRGKKYMFAITDYPVRYVNSEDRGNPFTAKMLNQSLKNAAKKAGISKKITTHFLRHTYVSKQASYGTVFNYDFIRQIGHADASTTHDIYDHINTINHDDLAKGYHKLDEDIANDNI